MAFLNKKEDVIDFQLTQYGKYLVSQGKFKPIYYAFFDDDILYDQRYASGSALETQKDIEVRILDDTPVLEAQYIFHSVDNLKPQDQLKRDKEQDHRSGYIEEVKEKIEPTPERHFTMTEPLGTSRLIIDKAPSFSIEFLTGEISSSFATLTGSSDTEHPIKHIPQINVKDVIFYSSIKDSKDEPAGGETELFEDGTYIHIEEDHISLRVEEENIPLSRENFDIEIYLLDENDNIEFPLYFRESMEQKNIQDGILIDSQGKIISPGGEAHLLQEDDADREVLLGPDMVGKYFDVLVDGRRIRSIED